MTKSLLVSNLPLQEASKRFPYGLYLDEECDLNREALVVIEDKIMEI